MAKAFFFRCPVTGMNLQGVGYGSLFGFITYPCPACGSVHLVDPLTGRLATEPQDDEKERWRPHSIESR